LAELFGFLEQVAGRSCIDPYGNPPSSLYEAIKDHLVVLLNTRRGSVSHLEDFGLPDLSDIYKGYPESLHYLGAEIKRTVEKYEPRLIQLKVELVSSSSDNFEANFAITGYLKDSGGKTAPVTFRTMISQGGRTHINQ
jgi:type VI secretion system protein